MKRSTVKKWLGAGGLLCLILSYQNCAPPKGMDAADADLSSMQVERGERTFEESDRSVGTLSSLSPLAGEATTQLAAVAPTSPVIPAQCGPNADGSSSFRIKLAFDKATKSYYNANKNGGGVYKVTQEVMPPLNPNIQIQPFDGQDIDGTGLPRLEFPIYKLSAYLRSAFNVSVLNLIFTPSWRMQRIGTIHDDSHVRVYFNSSYFPTIDSVYNVAFFFVTGGARIGALKNISHAFLLNDSIPLSVDHVQTLSVSELTISEMIKKGAGEFCGNSVRVLPPTKYRLCGLYRGGTDQATNMVASPNPQWSIPNNVYACRMYCDNSEPQPGDQCISGTTVLKTYR